MARPRWLYKPVGVNEKQVTREEHGHVLHNAGVWSPDSKWIVYDTRSDEAGDTFDGDTIAAVNCSTREVRTLFRARNGAKCGMASFNPVSHKREIVFTLGPENPIGAWTYAPHRRRGALVDCAPQLKFKSRGSASDARVVDATEEKDEGDDTHSASSSTERKEKKKKFPPPRTLDARDLLPDRDGEFTPGALRGGTGSHSFSPDGVLVSSAYEDAVLMRNGAEVSGSYGEVEKNYRAVAVTALDGKGGVLVDTSEHPRNHSGEGFTVVLTTHQDDSRFSGSEASCHHRIARAGDACWVGLRGYGRGAAEGGGWQGRALTFLGEVETNPESREANVTNAKEDLNRRSSRSNRSTRRFSSARASGGKHLELFVLDLLVDPSAVRVQSGPAARLAGTATERPRPPFGVKQRRVTFTDARAYPGLTAGAPSSESFVAAASAAEPDPGRATKGNSAGKALGIKGARGPRFWPRTSPDGRLACVVALDEDGIPQAYAVRLRDASEASGASLLPVTQLPRPGVQSAFAWRPDGSAVAFVHDGSVCVARVPDCLRGSDAGGPIDADVRARELAKAARLARRNRVARLTQKTFGKETPRPESVIFSPDGTKICYSRRVIRRGMRAPTLCGRPFEDASDDVDGDGVDDWFNQIFVVKYEERLRQPFGVFAALAHGTAAGIAVFAAGVAAQKVSVSLRAASRRFALRRLRAKAGEAVLEPAPRPAPADAWRSFADDVEKTSVTLGATPRAAPRDAWAKFAAEQK